MTKTTVEELRYNFSYDPETGLLKRIKEIRSKFRVGDTVGTINSEGYLTVYVSQEKLFVHRVAWALSYGDWPSGSLDHKDRNKTNNRIDNLRIANNVQNLGNIKRRAKSGFKGVVLLPSGRYQAAITMKAKRTNIGVFDTAEEAADAYDKAAVSYFGEFALLNNITVKG